jgi:hypothetical protein
MVSFGIPCSSGSQSAITSRWARRHYNLCEVSDMPLRVGVVGMEPGTHFSGYLARQAVAGGAVSRRLAADRTGGAGARGAGAV